MTIEPTLLDESDNSKRILLAALNLFATKGYAGTSIREIVHEAQVTNPMVYYYFGNKEGLFHGLIASLQSDFHEKMLEATERCPDAATFVRTCIEMEVYGFKERPEVFRFIYGVLFGPPGSVPKHRMFERHDLLEQELSQRWNEFVPGDERGVCVLFAWIHAWIMGALRAWEETPEAEKSHYLNRIGADDVEQLTTFFLRGIGIQ